MYGWRNKGWIKSSTEEGGKPEEHAYKDQWEFICSLGDSGVKFEGIKEEELKNPTIATLNGIAVTLKKELMKEFEKNS